MTLTKHVVTKDLFQALIRAKRGVRPLKVDPAPMPTVGAPAYARLLVEGEAVETTAQLAV